MEGVNRAKLVWELLLVVFERKLHNCMVYDTVRMVFVSLKTELETNQVRLVSEYTRLYNH